VVNGGSSIKSIKALLGLQFVVALIIAVLLYAYLAHQKPAPTPSGMIEGILYASNGSSVVINGQVLEEGDVISGITIVKISRDKVEFEKDKTHWTQRVREAPSMHWQEPI